MTTNTISHDTQTQATLWNGAAGCAWVDAEAILDAMFKPIEQLLTEAAAASSARNVLDVGCGTGATTLALARALAPEGRCCGIDLSEPMIAAARARAERDRSSATFVRADAEYHAFEPAAFDTIMSRFGVMFFEDNVRAFTNLRKAARDGAHLLLVTWRDMADNPFMTAAERAAAPLLAAAGIALPPRTPHAPGQFGLADADRARRFLEQSGWADIDINPLDIACAFPGDALDLYATRMGPLGRVLGKLDEPTRARVAATARAAFEPWVVGGEVRFVAACWAIAARAG